MIKIKTALWVSKMTKGALAIMGMAGRKMVAAAVEEGRLGRCLRGPRVRLLAADTECAPRKGNYACGLEAKAGRTRRFPNLRVHMQKHSAPASMR